MLFVSPVTVNGLVALLLLTVYPDAAVVEYSSL
ncbi:unannotated protein [freshwater metagenome]|uniref:Unannotated protein n=1 Tax=freshwater metagenome TaxID=449393 RepID=A0A6J6GBN3_9ZZZZ